MRVGIITHYFNNKNYGGNLQAYALCKVVNNLGHEAEQISYVYSGTLDDMASVRDKMKKMSPMTILKKGLHKLMSYPSKLYTKMKYRKYLSGIDVRLSLIDKFNKERIPHSEIVYDKNSIKKADGLYDAYITGSDQVWNMAWYNSAFFLDFVSGGRKLSYAASVAMDSYTKEQEEIVSSALSDFDGISVREEKSRELIAPLVDGKVSVHLDPTLLLTREDWDEICDDRLVEEDYLFCYFLGDNRASRECAKEYARRHHLRIVNIPFLSGLNKSEKIVKDIEILDISIGKFISLIKHAKCVMTDSFHATVFSNIYHKQYFVFSKNDKNTMASRIYTLTSLFHSEDRFLDSETKRANDYVDSIEDIDYSKENMELNDLRMQSIAYLEDMLRD